MKRCFLTVALAFPGTVVISAESPPQLPATLDACANIEDSAQRLTCYDREVATLRKAIAAATAARPAAASSRPAAASTRPAAASTVPAAVVPPVPAAPQTAVASAAFGQELLGKSARAEDELANEELHAKIASLREIRPGEFQFSLDNGQTWRQMERPYEDKPKAGEAITIKKGKMNSYRLYRDGVSVKQWVRVVRTQ